MNTGDYTYASPSLRPNYDTQSIESNSLDDSLDILYRVSRDYQLDNRAEGADYSDWRSDTWRGAAHSNQTQLIPTA